MKAAAATNMKNDQTLPLADLRQIAIFRALQLGDMLCAVPALRALRQAAPKAVITLIGLPWAKKFHERYSTYVDRFIAFPGYPGLPERSVESSADLEDVVTFLTNVQRQQFDLVLQMHGSGGVTNPLTALFAGRIHAGFAKPGVHGWGGPTFLPYPDQAPEIHRCLRLVEHIGAKSCGDNLEFPLADADFECLIRANVWARLRQSKFVCLHPGARDPARRWEPQAFAAVAEALIAEGYQIALTGSASEVGLTQAVMAGLSPSAQCACVDTACLDLPLGALGALLSRARLLLCNDTGISHLAVGLDVPSVVVFLASDPNRWAPLDHQRHRVLENPDTDSVLRQVRGVLRECEVTPQGATACSVGF